MFIRNNFPVWCVACVLVPLFVATSADSEQHPLNGTWIGQLELEEAEAEGELIFHPDGTFQMALTVVGSWETAFEEDYTYEDEYVKWDEFLPEIDSNANGVLDEQDFEAALERGDEDVPSSWDDVLQEFGDINGDGIIDQGEFERTNERRLKEGTTSNEGDDGLVEFMTDTYGEVMAVTISATGTWEAADDEITLTYGGAWAYKINGLTLREFYAIYLEALFNMAIEEAAMLEQEEIDEEEWLLFMRFVFSLEFDEDANAVDMLEPETPGEELSLEELRGLVIDQMVEEQMRFDWQPEMPEMEVLSFSLNGNHLRITDGDDGETDLFIRLDDSSAIAVFSWGQIKDLNR